MVIDNDGVAEIQEKIGNPLRSMFDKLEKTGDFNKVADEFDFIFKFLGQIESWDKPNIKRQKKRKKRRQMIENNKRRRKSN